VPKVNVADGMIRAITRYLNISGKTCIKHIFLVDIDKEMVSLWESNLISTSYAEAYLPKSFQSQDVLNTNTLNPNEMPQVHRSSPNIPQDKNPKSTKHLSEGTSLDPSDKNLNVKPENCSICMCDITNPKTLDCRHTFCTDCIDRGLKIKPVCPVCGNIYGKLTGNQPFGTMNYKTNAWNRLPGYQDCGSIEISYHIPDGTQTVSP
jgi:hypothetical protein